MTPETPTTFWHWIQPQIAPLLTVIVAASAVIAGQINAARTAAAARAAAKASDDRKETALHRIEVNTDGRLTEALNEIRELKASVAKLHESAIVSKVKSDADDETIRELEK